MDDKTVEWSEKRFKDIKKESFIFLKKFGFKKDNLAYIPISGFQGINLFEKQKKMKWYNGPTLLEAVDKLPVPKRPYNKPLRIPL